MKKLVYMFLTFTVVLVGSSAVNAFESNSKKDKAKTRMVSSTQQIEQIMTLIGIPDINLSEDSKVNINFTINEDNIIEVNEVVSENKVLKELIYKKVNGKRINGNEVEIKNQFLNLQFVIQKEDIYTIY